MKPSDFAGGAAGFSGSHDATIALVQSGAYEAGAVNQQVWTTSVIEGKANPAKVVAIWRTPPYPDYQWLAQPDLDQRVGQRVGPLAYGGDRQLVVPTAGGVMLSDGHATRGLDSIAQLEQFAPP